MTERPAGWVPQNAHEAQAYIDEGGDDPALLDRCQWEIDREARPQQRADLGPHRRSPYTRRKDDEEESQPE